jgi:hypothetical protein
MGSTDTVEIFKAIWVQRVKGLTFDGAVESVGCGVAASLAVVELFRCPPELAWMLRCASPLQRFSGVVPPDLAGH